MDQLKSGRRLDENKLSRLIHVYLTRHPSHEIPHLLQHKWTKIGPYLQLAREKHTHTMYDATEGQLIPTLMVL